MLNNSKYVLSNRTLDKFTENLTLKGSNSNNHGQGPWLKDKVQSVLACVFGTKTMTKHKHKTT